jgi:hypothetical protein
VREIVTTENMTTAVKEGTEAHPYPYPYQDLQTTMWVKTARNPPD